MKQPREAAGSTVSQSQPSTASQSQHSGTPISKKEYKRPNKPFKAEASARGLIYNINEGQEAAKRRREVIEECPLQWEEKMAAEESERDCAYSTTITETKMTMARSLDSNVSIQSWVLISEKR